MNNKVFFTVPDYFPDFTCKGGACRHSCCNGFKVGISLDDYNKLLGISCSKDLRQRLDCALKVVSQPSPSSFAFINPKWDGTCPIQDGEGYCALQRECGESALANVCKVYPRSPKALPILESSCANSCEHTLELLFHHVKPLEFISRPAENLPPSACDPNYHEIRSLIIKTLQNRCFSLEERILQLGDITRKHTLQLGDMTEKQRVYGVWERSGRAEKEKPLSINAPTSGSVQGEGILHIIAWFCEEYPQFKPFGDKALEGLRSMACFKKGSKENLNIPLNTELLPHLNIFMEQTTVNHVFYSGFPFSRGTETLEEEFEILKGIYYLLDYIVAGIMEVEPEEDQVIDAVASFFRIVEHTNFDHNILVLISREKALGKFKG